MVAYVILSVCQRAKRKSADAIITEVARYIAVDRPSTCVDLEVTADMGLHVRTTAHVSNFNRTVLAYDKSINWFQ